MGKEGLLLTLEMFCSWLKCVCVWGGCLKYVNNSNVFFFRDSKAYVRLSVPINCNVFSWWIPGHQSKGKWLRSGEERHKERGHFPGVHPFSIYLETKMSPYTHSTEYQQHVNCENFEFVRGKGGRNLKHALIEDTKLKVDSGISGVWLCNSDVHSCPDLWRWM